MAINVLRGRPRTSEEEPESLAIGETDREIFGCPICSRPLAVGTRRCPACRTRLFMGVPFRRVSMFAAVGVVGAVALVVTLATLISVTQALGARAGSVNEPAPAASTTPGGSIGGSAGPGAQGRGVPPRSRGALDQSAAINAHFLDGSTRLRSALARADIDSVAVASILRDLASDATFGADLVSRVGAWDKAALVAADLDDLYAAVRSTARTGLAASLTNDRAYRAAAQRMVTVLRRVPTVNKAILDLATTAGLDLPSLPRPATP